MDRRVTWFPSMFVFLGVTVGFVLWKGEAGGILTKIVLGVCQSGIKIVILIEPKPINFASQFKTKSFKTVL